MGQNPQTTHGPIRRRHILKFSAHLASVVCDLLNIVNAQLPRIHISSPHHPPLTASSSSTTPLDNIPPQNRPPRVQPPKMTTTAAATLSIQKDPSYGALKSCAQTCVDKNSNNNDLEGHLKCGDLKILDSCFCGLDNRPKASAFLSSCIVTRCKYTAAAELTSVYGVYDGYCGFKPTKAVTVSATTTTKKATTTSLRSTKTGPTSSTEQSSTIVSSSAMSSIPVSDIESTASTTTPTLLSATAGSTPTLEPSVAADPPKMPPGAIAGAAIGGLAGIFLIIAILMWFCRRGQRQEEHTFKSAEEFCKPASSYASTAPLGSPASPYTDTAPTPVRSPAAVAPVSPMTPQQSVRRFSYESEMVPAVAVAGRMGRAEYKDTYPLVQRGPVEMGQPGFRAELSAGDDGMWRREKP